MLIKVANDAAPGQMLPVSGTPDPANPGFALVKVSGGGGGGGGTADSTAANQVLQLAQETAINAKLPATLGQKASAASMAVVMASDQSPVPVYSPASYVVVPFTRPANTTAYAAGDAVGAASAINTFANVGSAGDDRLITSAKLRIDVGAIPSGMAAFRLHFYSASPAAIADNGAWDLVPADRSLHLDYIDFPVPLDMGSTLLISVSQVNKHIKLASSSLFGVLVTVGAFTPGAVSEVYELTIGTVRL